MKKDETDSAQVSLHLTGFAFQVSLPTRILALAMPSSM